MRSFETIVSSIAATTAANGLSVRAELDGQSYRAGIKVADEELAQVHRLRDKFDRDWNYEIRPGTLPRFATRGVSAGLGLRCRSPTGS